MLILQRKIGESVVIGDDVTVTVMAVDGARVRLAVSAPKDVLILRSELVTAAEANQDSAKGDAAPMELLKMIVEHRSEIGFDLSNAQTLNNTVQGEEDQS